MDNIVNPSVESKGGGYTINVEAMKQMTPGIKQIKADNQQVMENLATTGVNELRALPNIPDEVDTVKIAEKSRELIDRYKNLSQVAKEKDTGAKDFPSGSKAPTEKYDYNVDADIQKRVKDNVRDESNIDRPFEFSKLKSFADLRANLTMKFKKVQSLLNQTKDRNQRNRLNYLMAKITNDLEKLATIEGTKWLNPEPKAEKDPRSDEEKMMKPENTGEIKNDINDLIQRARFQAWKVPDSLKKKAMEDLDKKQIQNIEQAVSELGKSDEDYKKDIETLETVMGKKATISDEDMKEIEKIGNSKEGRVPKKAWQTLARKYKKGAGFDNSKCISDMCDEEGVDNPESFCGWLEGKATGLNKKAMEDDEGEEKPEKDDKEDTDDKKEKKDDKKDDKKEDKKDKKEDKDKDEDEDKDKDKGKKKGKEGLEERMKKMREKRKLKKKVEPGDEEEKPGLPEAPGKSDESAGPPMGPPPDKEREMPRPPVMGGMKNDLTAEFNPVKAKAESYWEVKDNEGSPILTFTGADAYGKKVFAEWKWFSSEDYGKSLLAQLRESGIEKVADDVNGKFHITKHAAYIESKAKDDKKDKEKKEKEEKKKKDKEDKEKKEAKEKKEKDEKDKKAKEKKDKKEASASPEISSYWQKYLAKGKDTREFGSKVKERVSKTTTASLDKNIKVTADENKRLLKENVKLKEEKNNLEDEKVLRSKAERALKLANKMINKKIIKAEDIEENVEKLTLMDDLSYSMMEDFVEKNENGIQSQASEGIKKEASKGKIKSGLSNIINLPEKSMGLRDRLSDMFMNRPKLAKLREFKEKNLI